jgi:hypothetical protein
MMDQDFSTLFQNLLEREENVTVINTYQWLTIANASRILGVGDGTLTLQVARHQTICLQLDKKCLIKGTSFKETISARVFALDFKANVVILTDLSHTRPYINRRKNVRVPVTEKIEVVFPDKPNAYGRLLDISHEGLGVNVNRASYSSNFFGMGKEISLGIMLPLGSSAAYKPILMKGMVRNIFYTEGDYFFRLGVRLFPQKGMMQAISRYIMLRELEMIKELESLGLEYARQDQ